MSLLLSVVMAVSGCSDAEEAPLEVPLAVTVEYALNHPNSLPSPASPTDALGGQVAAAPDAGSGAADADAGQTQDASIDAGEATADGAQSDVGGVPDTVSPPDEPPSQATDVRRRRPRGRRSSTPRRPATKRAPRVKRVPPKPAPKPTPEPKPQPTAEEEVDPALQGKDATELLYEGKKYMRAGRFKDAIRVLKASQRLRPSATTLTYLGRAYFDAGALRSAEKTLIKAGRAPDAMLLLGTLYQQMGAAPKARRVYKAFLTYHPDHPKAERARQRLRSL